MSDREQFEAARAAGLKARHETRVERANKRDPDEALITKLTTALDRSVPGYAVRRWVAKTHLLPLVKALLKEHECSCPHISEVDDYCPQHRPEGS